MSDTPPPTYPPQVPRPTKPRTGLVMAFVVVFVVIVAALGIGIGYTLAHKSNPGATASPSAGSVDVAAPAATDAVVAPPAEMPPSPANFQLAVKILSKHCFGSAGCNVTFRIEVTYSGDPMTKVYRVTYEVHGAEDPFSDSFEFDYQNHQVTIDDQSMMSTKSSKAVLTAKAVDVLEG